MPLICRLIADHELQSEQQRVAWPEMSRGWDMRATALLEACSPRGLPCSPRVMSGGDLCCSGDHATTEQVLVEEHIDTELVCKCHACEKNPIQQAHAACYICAHCNGTIQLLYHWSLRARLGRVMRYQASRTSSLTHQVLLTQASGAGEGQTKPKHPWQRGSCKASVSGSANVHKHVQHQKLPGGQMSVKDVQEYDDFFLARLQALL